MRSRRSASRSRTALVRAEASWAINMATTTMIAMNSCVTATLVAIENCMPAKSPRPCVAMTLARNAATAPASAAPNMFSRNAANASTGRISIDGGKSVQNAVADSAAVTSKTPAVSHGRRRTMVDWVAHSRIGAPTARTPSASPAHQLSAATNHLVPASVALTRPPISPPNSGAIRHAPATKTMKSRRLLRSGRPPHQARTTVAPISGSTILANANPAATGNELP